MQIAVIILLTTSFNETVVVTEIIILSMVRSCIIFQSGESLTFFNKNNRANFFCGKKKTVMKLFGVYIVENMRKNIHLISPL